MKVGKVYVFLCAVLLFAMLLGACSQTDEKTGETGAEKTAVTVGLLGEPTSLDPQKAMDAQSWIVYGNIYDTIVNSGDGCFTDVKPQLAESWEVGGDGLVYTFHFRQDVDFHNGEHLTAEDARFSLERAMKEPLTSAYLTMIEKVEVSEDDEYTLIVTLNMPNAEFLQTLGALYYSVVNEKAITEAGEDYSRKPVGTGAYKFESWALGESVKLVANDDYFGGAPVIKKVTYRFLPDSNTALIALQKGEIDALPNTNAVDIATVDKDPKLTLFEGDGHSLAYLGFNIQQPPFDDVRVRRAVSYALNREEIMMGAIGGAGLATASALNPTMLGYNADFPPVNEQNIEKAKELLKEAGYEKGFTTSLPVVAAANRDKAAQIVQAQLKEIGITVKVEVMDRGPFFELLSQGNFEMYLGSVNQANTDMMLTCLYSSNGAFNYGQVYSNPEVDNLLKEAIKITDTQKRVELYQDVVKTTYEDLNKVPIYFLNEFFSANAKLMGIEIVDNVYFPVAKWSWAE